MNKCIATKKAALISTAGLLLGLSAGAVFAQQNLIINGSFENGPDGLTTFPGWDLIGPADNNSDFGVASSGVSPDMAEQGTNYAFFHGNPTDGSQDCLGKSVNLIPGAQYAITYYLATDGTTLGSGAAMWAVIGTSFGIDYSQDISLSAYWPNSSNALPYQKFTTNYTATNATEMLSFHGIDATSSILLDNVSMTLIVPQLNLNVSPSNTLVFNWTSWTNGFRLQTSASPATKNWVMLTNTPVTVGSSNQIVLPAPASASFYRLMLP